MAKENLFILIYKESSLQGRFFYVFIITSKDFIYTQIYPLNTQKGLIATTILLVI